jgi:hypothetical protein
MTHARIPFALVFAGVVFLAGPAAAAGPVIGEPAIIFVPTASAPTPPAGLKVTCLKEISNGAPPSDTCPVVKYNGYTVWAFSFNDNRLAMALVTYDEHKSVVGNITKNGARYVWNETSSLLTKNVQFFGQANQYVSATWAELFPGQPVDK